MKNKGNIVTDVFVNNTWVTLKRKVLWKANESFDEMIKRALKWKANQELRDCVGR